MNNIQSAAADRLFNLQHSTFNIQPSTFMGKSSKLKKLRKLASQLPVIQTKTVVSKLVKGRDIIAESKQSSPTDVNGIKINPELNYRRKELVEVPLNHYKKMKQNYNKAGMAGAALYARSAIEYAKQQSNNPTIPTI